MVKSRIEITYWLIQQEPVDHYLVTQSKIGIYGIWQTIAIYIKDIHTYKSVLV
jgi:hypothetical protein